MINNKVFLTVEKDGQISGNVPEALEICNQRPLEITFKKGASIYVELNLTFPIDIHYTFEPFSTVKLIEIRQFERGGEMKHQMDVLASSQVTAAFLNEGDHEGELRISEVSHVYRDANLEVSYGELGDGKTMANYTYELDEPGASTHLHLAAISRHEDHKHFQVTLNHHAPHTYGMMENYGVTRHTSMLTFDGVGRIDKGMHQSESHQTSRIIVFEPTCVARANPYLYIDDYDVKASHAASVGAMNEEHLYYLQSRGLTKKQAMHLITLGYLLPAISVIKDEALMTRFETMLLGKVGDE